MKDDTIFTNIDFEYLEHKKFKDIFKVWANPETTNIKVDIGRLTLTYNDNVTFEKALFLADSISEVDRFCSQIEEHEILTLANMRLKEIIQLAKEGREIAFK